MVLFLLLMSLALLLTPVMANANIPTVTTVSSTVTSELVDWSAYMPTPEYQNFEGSCSAWATAYDYDFLEAMYQGWSVKEPDHQFSPAYIYNQLNDGTNNGITIFSAIDLLANQGCDTLADMPYENIYDGGNWVILNTAKPTSDQIKNAAIFKLPIQWITLSSPGITAQKVKQILAAGPVVAATGCFTDSPGWQSGDISLSDIRSLPQPGSVAAAVQLPPDGTHAICIVGYDDSRQNKDGFGAFKFINSWGTNWGHDGYGWMSYAYANKEIYEVDSATVMAPTAKTEGL